ncbi:MAG: HAD family hydrolase [Deltaproteobacteria bacterium]
MKNGLFLDLDETIISVSSEKSFLTYLYKIKKISKREILEIVKLFIMHKMFLIKDYKEAKKKTARLLLKNKNCKEIIDIYNTFFDTYMVNSIYSEIYDIIRLHKEQNNEVYIISASLDFIVEKFCCHLGANGYFAIQAERKNGFFTGEILEPIMFSEEKANIIKKLSASNNINLKNSYAYSDSFLDIPMLSVVGNPVTVNPDKQLFRQAKSNGWKIIKLSNSK